MSKNQPTETPVREWPAIRAFRKLFAARAWVDEQHRRFLADQHGLAVGEFDLIAELGNTEGLRMGALAAKMVTSPANVTRIATRLEKRGLVQRRRAAKSDREVLASLTEEGDAFFRAHFLEVAEFTRRLMESGLDREELATLASLCERLRQGDGSDD